MYVTENETLSAIPKSGWVRDYVIYAMQQTTAPLCYHLAVGLTTFGVTCPIWYGMHYAGDDLRANNFCLLVGRSGEDNKSTALGIGKKLLLQASPENVGDYPGSAEGLYESLQIAPTQLIPISEFGKMLASAQSGYFEPIKATLADAWDNQPLQRRRANGKTVIVPNPRLSITAACSLPYLESYTLAADWSGGFMGRWLVMYGKRERVDPYPCGTDVGRQALLDTLTQRSKMPQAGFCVGFEQDALNHWVSWYTSVEQRALCGNGISVHARAPTLALKACLVYGWDFGPAPAGQPWRISMDILEPAIALTELHIRSIQCLADVIAEHPDARLQRTIVAAINKYGGAATFGEILRELKMRKRPVAEMLDALVESGRVRRMDSALGANTYELVGSTGAAGFF